MASLGNTDVLESLNHLIDTEFCPKLNQDGFTEQSGPTGAIRQFVRKEENAQLLLEIRKDRLWRRGSGRFRVELGVLMPQVEALFGHANRRAQWSVTELNPDLRANLGMLAYCDDRPWLITASPDSTRKLVGRLLSAWSAYGLDWLEKHNSPQAAVRALEENGRDVHPAYYMAAGEITKARKAAAKALKTHPRRSHALARFAVEHGLIAPDSYRALNSEHLDRERFARIVDQAFFP